MRSFAILATVCAATVGTASGKNTVWLAPVQNVCGVEYLLVQCVVAVNEAMKHWGRFPVKS